MGRILRAGILALTVAALPLHAAAEWELSVYTGIQSAPHSDVSGNVAGIGPFDVGIGWEGRSFETPPYYGFRLTKWMNENRGFALEFNHAKVYGDEDDIANAGFSRLEFTDGINYITVNYMHRFTDVFDNITPMQERALGSRCPMSTS